ncbi:serine/threonine-protein kinase [Pengzhenrongella sp.]|jgi:serine/threonine protein kinase|uniref:serine/threonine-protein kinase n=1 Tax=Pengzhenrongella sp. TaxID=2888820 RepID=UPI002F925542
MESSGLAPGTDVGGYRIVAPLGSGGMGTVYRAVDGGGTVVALKLLHPHIGADPVARERLRREVSALQRLHHPAVAAVLDAEADSTEAFVVTELVDGMNLDEHVRAHGPLAPRELARLADGLRDVLEAVHAAGVVHRDLKPSNVLMTDDGPVLIDFGIAQAADDIQLTSGNLVVGTPGYLAPELLADAEPSPVSDWWGWAAVLAFAATGRSPFGTRPMDTVLARSQAGDVDVIGLGPLTAGALRAALDPDPDLRALPDDLVADLADAAEHGDSPPPTVAFAARPVEVPTQVIPQDTRTFWPDDDVAVAGEPVPEPEAPSYPEATDAFPESPEPYTAARPRRRTGSVLALALLMTTGAALYPGVTAAVVLGALVLFRTVGSAGDALDARRERRGGVGRSDAVRTVAASPWHLLRGVVGLVPSLAFGAGVAVVVGGVLWWSLATNLLVLRPIGIGGGTAPGGGNETWVYGAALASGMLAGLVTVWTGPLGRLTRLGARRTLGVLAPPNPGAVIVVVLALAGAVAFVTLVTTGQDVAWWPLHGLPRLP